MSPRVSFSFRCLAACACAGVLFPGAAAAQDVTIPELGFLGLRPTWRQEIERITSQAEQSGDFRRGMSELLVVIRDAQVTHDDPAFLEAELAWVKLAARDEEETELDDALEDLISRARDLGLARQEAEVYTFWAERLEDEGEWLMALRALDSAAQASLGDDRVNGALRAMLTMSRLCRENDHPWRLQQVWVRIAQVEGELAASIDISTRELLELERAEALQKLGSIVPVARVSPKVDLQPSRAAVRVSAPHGEVGRARFFLTNETVRTVKGTLNVAARTGALKKWESGHSGHWLTLGPPSASAKAPIASARSMSLRPGERISVYVEREQPAREDTISLTWAGADGDALAAGEFSFAGKQPRSSVVNAGSFTVRPGWSLPLYHEINYRGAGLITEDFQFETSVPCRLEVFDVDGGRNPAVEAGRLLAVDAEGDGCFTGSEDRVVTDANADGNPDILIGDRTRSLEIFAWPLIPLAEGEEITVSARLKRPDQPDAWRTDAENSLAPAEKSRTEVKTAAR